MADPVRHLKRVDPVLGAVITRVRRRPPPPASEGTHFDAIIRSIIYQQLSGKAAGTIHRRFLALYGDRAPTPEELLATPEETLRGVGLSRQKLGYLRDLAERARSGEVPFETLHELDDDAILDRLTRIRGVGRWTVQMFLMFRLGRPDVLPELDLGIQNAIQRAYGLKARPTPKEVKVIGERWSPFASHASWYLWRSLELPEGKTKQPAATKTAKPPKAAKAAKAAKRAKAKPAGRQAARKASARKSVGRKTSRGRDTRRGVKRQAG